MVSCQSPETIGIRSEIKPAANSARIAVRLLPTLSMNDPRNGASRSVGIAVIATTNPALVALPVISSAIQGIAIKVMEPEITEAMDANCMKTKGVSLRCTNTSFAKDPGHSEILQSNT